MTMVILAAIRQTGAPRRRPTGGRKSAMIQKNSRSTRGAKLPLALALCLGVGVTTALAHAASTPITGVNKVSYSASTMSVELTDGTTFVGVTGTAGCTPASHSIDTVK